MFRTSMRFREKEGGRKGGSSFSTSRRRDGKKGDVDLHTF